MGWAFKGPIPLADGPLPLLLWLWFQTRPVPVPYPATSSVAPAPCLDVWWGEPSLVQRSPRFAGWPADAPAPMGGRCRAREITVWYCEATSGFWVKEGWAPQGQAIDATSGGASICEQPSTGGGAIDARCIPRAPGHVSLSPCSAGVGRVLLRGLMKFRHGPLCNMRG